MSKKIDNTINRKSAHFIMQGKGGVGKSFVSTILAQYLISKNKTPVKCIDTDPVNQTFLSYKALNAEHINIMDGSKVNERKFDKLIEKIISEEGTFVIDSGASTFIPLSNYIIENNSIQLLDEYGVDVFIHTIVTGGQSLVDTVSGLHALSKQTETKNICVWLNEFFGKIERDGKKFKEMKVYEENKTKIKGIFSLRKRTEDTFGQDIEELVSKKLTFNEMRTAGFEIAVQQRIKVVQRDIYEQLDTVQFQ